jgi:hypothetical protein
MNILLLDTLVLVKLFLDALTMFLNRLLHIPTPISTPIPTI